MKRSLPKIKVFKPRKVMLALKGAIEQELDCLAYVRVIGKVNIILTCHIHEQLIFGGEKICPVRNLPSGRESWVIGKISEEISVR